MTPEEYNRLAAEKVLGWKFDQPPGEGFFCLEAKERLGDKHAPVWMVAPNGDRYCGWCESEQKPDPYHNIAHAFELVEKLREKGWLLNMDDDGTPKRALWIAYFYQYKPLWHPDPDAYVLIDNPAAAITIAALRAVEAIP